MYSYSIKKDVVLEIIQLHHEFKKDLKKITTKSVTEFNNKINNLLVPYTNNKFIINKKTINISNNGKKDLKHFITNENIFTALILGLVYNIDLPIVENTKEFYMSNFNYETTIEADNKMFVMAECILEIENIKIYYSKFLDSFF